MPYFMKEGIPMRIASAADLEAATLELGFLPMFAHAIPGYSVEELCLPEIWFREGVDGPWEWKGPLAQGKRCLYGKFFRGRAGFVSRAWFPALANYRRGGLDADARFELGLTPALDRRLYELVREEGSLNTKALKWRVEAKKGFDAAVTRLQMHTDWVVSDFEYQLDRHGRPYGWGIARYATPEAWLGEGFRPASEPPEASLARMLEQLRRACPQADEKALARLLRG